MDKPPADERADDNLADLVWAASRRLPQGDRRFVEMLYTAEGESYSDRDIGRIFKVTWTRASQCLARAFGLIREAIGRPDLDDLRIHDLIVAGGIRAAMRREGELP
jgi:DNA-directed RNA polymerase sigma subunit (sigma70/sigma32)